MARLIMIVGSAVVFSLLGRWAGGNPEAARSSLLFFGALVFGGIAGFVGFLAELAAEKEISRPLGLTMLALVVATLIFDASQATMGLLFGSILGGLGVLLFCSGEETEDGE
jgi:hypothetical protein